MPQRQHELPHTTGPKGPCDSARDAYAEALETAAEAASEKKRRKEALVDRMLSTNTPRVPFVDAKGKRRWLVITAGEPRLKSEKAQAGEPGLDRQSRVDGAAGAQGAKDRYGQPIGMGSGLRPDEESAEAGGGLTGIEPDPGPESDPDPEATDDANVADQHSEETSAQAAVREAETARAGRRKRGGK